MSRLVSYKPAPIS